MEPRFSDRWLEPWLIDTLSRIRHTIGGIEARQEAHMEGARERMAGLKEHLDGRLDQMHGEISTLDRRVSEMESRQAPPPTTAGSASPPSSPPQPPLWHGMTARELALWAAIAVTSVLAIANPERAFALLERLLLKAVE